MRDFQKDERVIDQQFLNFLSYNFVDSEIDRCVVKRLAVCLLEILTGGTEKTKRAKENPKNSSECNC